MVTVTSYELIELRVTLQIQSSQRPAESQAVKQPQQSWSITKPSAGAAQQPTHGSPSRWEGRNGNTASARSWQSAKAVLRDRAGGSVAATGQAVSIFRPSAERASAEQIPGLCPSALVSPAYPQRARSADQPGAAQSTAAARAESCVPMAWAGDPLSAKDAVEDIRREGNCLERGIQEAWFWSRKSCMRWGRETRCSYSPFSSTPE